MEAYPQSPTRWERIVAFLRRHREVILSSILIPLLLAGYDWYLNDMEFPVVPEIITREEMNELTAGRGWLYAEGGYLNRPIMPGLFHTGVGGSQRAWDLDEDGEPDMFVQVARHYPLEDGYFYVSSGIERNHFLDRLLHPGTAAIQNAGFVIETKRYTLKVILYNTEDASPERFRAIIEDMLTEVRAVNPQP